MAVNQDAEQENLWNKILSEASRSVNDRLDTKTVLVLGDKNTGKSTLVTRLQGGDIVKIQKGVALGYSFLDIRNNDDDDTTPHLNVWQLEGEVELKDLLKFALNPNTINNFLALITLDFSQPWNLIESLNKWLTVLQKHISSVSIQLPPGAYNELKNSLAYDFQNYQEPNDANLVSKHKKKRPIDDTDLLPLKEGTLSYNLGIPIVVVCTKTDMIVNLEKEYNYKEAHFDYIQQYIRRICLQYGAGLIYTSAKKDKNCDVILKYIKHVLYGLEFTTKPQLLEKDILFMPIGADSLAKIKVDFDNQNLTKDPDEPFEEIIKIPKRLQAAKETIDPIVLAEDDQEFLAKHKEVLDKEKLTEAQNRRNNPTGTTPPANPVLSGVSSRTEPVTSTGSAAPVAVAPRPPATAPTLPQVANLVPSISDPTRPPSSNEHQVLSDFFNSLINKDRNPLGGKKVDVTKLSVKPTGSPNGSFTGSSREDLAKQLEKLKKDAKN